MSKKVNFHSYHNPTTTTTKIKCIIALKLKVNFLEENHEKYMFMILMQAKLLKYELRNPSHKEKLSIN